MAAAIEGDAVTFLSNNWNDVNSFAFPYNVNNRNAQPTAYRAAIISGKGIPFCSLPARRKTSARTAVCTTSFVSSKTGALSATTEARW